jgi:uncharacterized protein
MRINLKLLSTIFVGVLAFSSLPSRAQQPAGPQPAGRGGARGAPGRGAPGRGARGALPGGICNAPCDPFPGMKKLLIDADVQTGYQHDSINHAMGVIEEMGWKTGIYSTWIRTDSQLITFSPIRVKSSRYANRSVNARNLNYFDAVLFLGSGEGTMSDQQKADLLKFVHDDGKGIVLGHAEGVNLYNWPEWGNMIGGFMANEYPASGMWAKVVDPSWKAAAAFGVGPFFWVDQWPVLKPQFKCGSVHTIVAMDPSKMTAQERARGRADDYYPIVWAKNYGKGRVFNITGGHIPSFYDNPRNQALIMEGIEWALGLTKEDATPDARYCQEKSSSGF